jgi:hypothetical protein
VKIVAAIYSLVLGAVALWAWSSYFVYEDSPMEHLLPAIAFNIVTLPSSLLVEGIVGQVPWMLNSPVAMLSVVTGFGGIQAALVWLIAVRSKFQGASTKRR